MNSKQLSVSNKQLAVSSILMGVFLFTGCGGFRHAATEAQKENAYLHERVCAAAAQRCADENASQKLCDLTTLAHDQSTVFVADYGLPENPLVSLNPSGPTATSPLQGRSFEDILSQAKQDSMRKPDVFALADGAMELGIALAGLVGGVYGIRIAGYLKQAREKSRALKEIIDGNELFKQLWPEQADRFKEAQKKQTPQTKRIVSQLKTAS